jgi:hypothetical protein
MKIIQIISLLLLNAILSYTSSADVPNNEKMAALQSPPSFSMIVSQHEHP